MDCYKNIQEDLNFNPRSREGSDTWMPSKRNGMSDFNPRSREGSDPTLRRYFIHFLISIRAPARGATGIKEFNDNNGEFQSALPRGERPLFSHALHIHSYFNPRSREGSDPTLRRYFIHFLISIRAPARGAT